MKELLEKLKNSRTAHVIAFTIIGGAGGAVSSYFDDGTNLTACVANVSACVAHLKSHVIGGIITALVALWKTLPASQWNGTDRREDSGPAANGAAKVLLFALLIGAPGIQAQDAAVVAIDSKDVAESTRLYKAMEDAKAAWEKHQESIRDKYVLVPHGSRESSGQMASVGIAGSPLSFYIAGSSARTISLNGDYRETPEQIQDRKAREAQEAKEQAEREKSYRYYRIGFTNGFRFSKDFKFIVPAEYKPAANSGSCIYGGGWTTPMTFSPAIGSTSYFSTPFNSGFTFTNQ